MVQVMLLVLLFIPSWKGQYCRMATRAAGGRGVLSCIFCRMEVPAALAGARDRVRDHLKVATLLLALSLSRSFNKFSSHSLCKSSNVKVLPTLSFYLSVFQRNLIIVRRWLLLIDTGVTQRERERV